MAEFYLVRHGQADYGAPGIDRFLHVGHVVAPLTNLGCHQLAEAAETLRAVEAELILSSPMTRALQSAAILARELNLPLAVEMDLHEWLPDRSFRRSGMDQAAAAYEEMMRLGGEWPPGEERAWEPLSAVHRRATDVLERYAAGERLVAVCHSLVIYSLTGTDVASGAVCRLTFDRAEDGQEPLP